MIRSRKQLYKSQLTRPKEQLRHTWWDVLGSVPLGLCLLRDSLFEDLGVFEKHHKQLFKPACWRKGVCAWALMWVGKYLPLSWESGKCEWAAHGDVGKCGRRSDGELCLPMALVAAASSCSKSAFFRALWTWKPFWRGMVWSRGVYLQPTPSWRYQELSPARLMWWLLARIPLMPLSPRFIFLAKTQNICLSSLT